MTVKNKIDYKKLNENKRFCNEDVIDKVAADLGLNPNTVRKVLEIQSEYTATTIRNGGMEQIIYPYIGRFKVNHRKVQKMMAKQMRS